MLYAMSIFLNLFKMRITKNEKIINESNTIINNTNRIIEFTPSFVSKNESGESPASLGQYKIGAKSETNS